MLSVWTSNASFLMEDSDIGSLPFYDTDITREFLKGRDTDRRIVCGLKGIGKTLLLKKKSIAARNSLTGVNFYPATELVERLRPFLHSLSKADVADLSTPEGWERVWRLAIAAVIVKRATQAAHGSEPLPYNLSAALEAVFPDTTATSLMYHIDKLMLCGAAERRRLIEVCVAPLENSVRALQSGLWMFVDAVDDCVSTHIGAALEGYDLREHTQFGAKSKEVWSAAQVGFALAAIGLQENQRHLKIFASLRPEAFERSALPNIQNLEAYLLPLRYSREDLRSIFRTKIEALRKQDPRQLSSPTERDPVSAFFGFSKLRHPNVLTQLERPLEEEVLDYILRHSRGRPRELDMVGAALELIPGRPRPADEVRRVVRDTSRVWFDWAKSEMFPFWRQEYDALGTLIESNFLSKTDRRAIVKRWQRLLNTSPPDDPFAALFDVGLAGCVFHGVEGVTQRFRQDDPELPVVSSEFRTAKLVVIHPCLNLATRPTKKAYRPHPVNVAGHGYPYVERDYSLHVHFGAGAIGVGLAIPLLSENSNTRLCIVQRKSGGGRDIWARLPLEGGRCRFFTKIWGEVAAGPHSRRHLEALCSVQASPEQTLHNEIRRWRAGKTAIFLVTDREDQVLEVLARARSVSTAVKSPESIAKLGRAIKIAGRGVKRVYAFENDVQAVEALSRSLEESGIRTVQVSVDRICGKVKVSDGDVFGECEDFFRIVINEDGPEARRLFGTGSRDSNHEVVFEADARKFGFEQLAKLALVNGVHFAFVVYAYDWICRNTANEPRVRGDLARMPLASLFMANQEVQDALEAVTNLYVLHVLVTQEKQGVFETADDVSQMALELLRRAAAVMQRLRDAPDVLERILGRDVQSVRGKMERYVNLLNDLPTRLDRTMLCSQFAQRRGITGDALRQGLDRYRTDCNILFEYLAGQ